MKPKGLMNSSFYQNVLLSEQMEMSFCVNSAPMYPKLGNFCDQ